MTWMKLAETRNFEIPNGTTVDLTALAGNYTTDMGWSHPENVKDLTVGQVAFVWSYGDWKRGVVTKIGRTKVTVTFVTRSGVDNARAGTGWGAGAQLKVTAKAEVVTGILVSSTPVTTAPSINQGAAPAPVEERAEADRLIQETGELIQETEERHPELTREDEPKSRYTLEKAPAAEPDVQEYAGAHMFRAGGRDWQGIVSHTRCAYEDCGATESSPVHVTRAYLSGFPAPALPASGPGAEARARAECARRNAEDPRQHEMAPSGATLPNHRFFRGAEEDACTAPSCGQRYGAAVHVMEDLPFRVGNWVKFPFSAMSFEVIEIERDSSYSALTGRISDASMARIVPVDIEHDRAPEWHPVSVLQPL